MNENEYDHYYNVEFKHWWFRVRRRIVKFQLNKIPHEYKNSVLDIGCGTGINLKLLFKDFKKKLGIDNNLKAVSYSNLINRSNICVHMDLSKLKKSSRFDVICLFDVLYHKSIDNYEETIKNLSNNLSDGGYILITDGAFNFLEGGHSKNVHSARRFNLKKLSHVLKNYNFKIIYSNYWGITTFFPLLIKRFLIDKLTYFSDEKSDIVYNKIFNNFIYKIYSIENYIFAKFQIPFGSSLSILVKKM